MPQADNYLLLYRNRVDEATASASSEVTDAEASFTQTMDPGDAWRATGKTSEYVQFDFGAAVPMTHAAAVWHNLDTTGTIAAAVSNDPTFATTIWASGDEQAWDPVSGFGWDDLGASLGGYPVLDSFYDWRPIKTFDMGGAKSARYARLTLKNPGNTLITGAALGRAFFGLGAQGVRNFGWDWVKEWDDPSDVEETESGVRVKRRRKKQMVKITTGFLKENEALSWFDDFKRTIGRSRDVILVLFPTNSAPKRYRTQIYGVPVDAQGVRNPFFDVYASQIHVRELTA